MTASGARWRITDDVVALDFDGSTAFEDSSDHWYNGVLRLLSLDDETARSWCEATASRSRAEHGVTPGLLSTPAFAEVLAESWRQVRPASRAASQDEVLLRARKHGPTDQVFATALPHDASAAVVGDSDPAHGRLVDAATGQLLEAPAYEETYFEGNVDGVGYGAYEAQADWRMEKAHRQVAGCDALSVLAGRGLEQPVRLLDVGSGYGYFRAAARDKGWIAEGLDVSEHACARAHATFGLETHVGTIDDLEVPVPYDLITLWDCIEHVDDSASLLRAAADRAHPGALVMLRTPNIEALEYRVFGNAYHSFKREHLHYFSPRSLAVCGRSAGLLPRVITTESHLLRGFSPGAVAEAAATQRGSDIVAVFEVVS